MPMINQFSGPRAALLWQNLCRLEWFFVAGAPASALIGYLSSRPDDPIAATLATGFALPMLIAETLKSNDSFRTFQRLLPVSASDRVLAELAAVLALMVWLLVGYHIGCALAAPGHGVPGPWILPAAVALGVLGVLLVHSGEAVRGIGAAFGLGGAAFAITFFAMVVFGPPYASATISIAGYALATLVVAPIVVTGYMAALQCARSPRLDDRAGLSALVRYVELGGPPRATTRATSPLSLKPQATAFTSPDAARRWHDWHFFWRIEFRSEMFWCCGLAWLFYAPFLMEDALTSDAQFPDFFFAVGLVLVATRFNWTWHDAPPGVPLSDWSRSRCFLRMAATVLAAGDALLWAGYAAHALARGEVAVAAALDPSPYIAALWVAWASLSLGPGMLGGLFLLQVWRYYAPQLPAGPVLLAACLAWLLLPVLFRRRTSFRMAALDAVLPVCAMAVIAAGYVSVERLSMPPAVQWTLREALGSLLVFALLRHHVRLGTFSPDSARRILRGLLTGIVAAWILVVLWGPFYEPENGVMAVILALGWVPPLFLPILTIPHYFAWMRAGADPARESRRKMPWMT